VQLTELVKLLLRSVRVFPGACRGNAGEPALERPDLLGIDARQKGVMEIGLQMEHAVVGVSGQDLTNC
ncbi:MAG TPA: hypothetical protein VLS53_03395, partial [Candidatus Dormibacteraeota bacterium]|nr:hypothetical protein [Candidatus Dormibacteraeota bacterium]